MLVVLLDRVGGRILLGDPSPDPNRFRWRAYLLRDQVEPETLSVLYFSLLGVAEERALPAPVLDWREISPEDWPERLRDQLQPALPVGKRLLLLSADQPPPDDHGDRLVVRLHPHGAFGTGGHPTTRLILEELEELFEAEQLDPDSRIADLGCGTGVLSLAAVRLGARMTLATDKDPLSVETAVLNRELNEIPEERLGVSIGSVETLRDALPNPADALLCNLRWSALEPLLPKITGLVSPGGRGLFSGFREDEAAKLRHALSARGWIWERTRTEDGWVGAVARREER